MRNNKTKTMQNHNTSTPPNLTFTCPQVNFQGQEGDEV